MKYCRKFIEMDKEAKLSALKNSRITYCKLCLRVPDHQDSTKKCKDQFCLNCGSAEHHHLLCKEGMLSNEQFRKCLSIEEDLYDDMLERETFIDLVMHAQHIDEPNP